MYAQAVHALVGEEQRDRSEGARQVAEGRLGAPGGVDHAPARARPEVLERPYQAAAAGRSGAAPLGERRGHDLAGHDAPEGEPALGIAGAQGRGVDAEQARHVVLAHVFEVPRGAAIPRHARLPRRDLQRVGRHERDGGGRGDVGEGQALGGEAHAGVARVGERPQVGADAVVVAHAAIDVERHRAAGRRRGHVGRLRAAIRGEAAEVDVEEIAARAAARHAGSLAG